LVWNAKLGGCVEVVLVVVHVVLEGGVLMVPEPPLRLRRG
jgi:hypothetical protein